MISGEALKEHRTGVNSGKTFQTSHADFFPRLQKNENVSDPVKAWNIGNADALEGPLDKVTTCAGMCCTFFPEPYVIQNSSTGSVLTTERARTITSVPLVLILMRRWPLKWRIKSVDHQASVGFFVGARRKVAHFRSVAGSYHAATVSRVNLFAFRKCQWNDLK